MSVAIFAALCAMPERTFITKESSFRVYVCPATGMQLGTPIFSAIFFSSARTFSPSPWKRARKLAAVPGRALAAGDGETGKLCFQLLQIEQKVLEPERCALAHGRGLRGLKVRPGERRRVGLARGKFGKRVDHRKQFAADELQRCAHLQKVGVIVHIAARRAEMDDACGLRAGVAERADVRHHVVAQPVLILGGTVKNRYRRGARAISSSCFVRDGQPQLLLALGEREPRDGGTSKTSTAGRRDAASAPRRSASQRGFS